jgi:rsbT co-antagonist protein RsbR
MTSNNLDLLEAMVERAPDGIVISALDGAIRYANPAFRKLLGYGDAMVGESVQRLHPAGEERCPDLVSGREDSWQGTLIYQRPDGTTLSARVSTFLLHDAEGRATAQAAIVRDAGELLQGEMALRQNQELLQSIVDNSTAVIFVKDKDGRYLMVNRRYETVLHFTRAFVRGKTDYDLFSADVAEHVRANDQAVIAKGEPIEVEEVVPSDDGPHTYISVKFPIHGPDGVITGVCGIATDITDRKRAEQAHAELQQQIIQAQQASLRELSTPLIPISEGVLAMPLIGSINSVRAQQIMETLLYGITTQRARIAILDVTGIKVVDTQVADALMRAARAAKLLGAEVVLTGIGPSVAMSLIQLGVNLGDVLTLGTLQSGIAHALRR